MGWSNSSPCEMRHGQSNSSRLRNERWAEQFQPIAKRKMGGSIPAHAKRKWADQFQPIAKRKMGGSIPAHAKRKMGGSIPAHAK
jgi:hypothetical protein